MTEKMSRAALSVPTSSITGEALWEKGMSTIQTALQTPSGASMEWDMSSREVGTGSPEWREGFGSRLEGGDKGHFHFSLLGKISWMEGAQVKGLGAMMRSLEEESLQQWDSRR